MFFSDLPQPGGGRGGKGGGNKGMNTDDGGPVRVVVVGGTGRGSQLDRNGQIEVPVNLTRCLPGV